MGTDLDSEQPDKTRPEDCEAQSESTDDPDLELAETASRSGFAALKTGLIAFGIGLLLVAVLNSPYQYTSSGELSLNGLNELDVPSRFWNAPLRLAGWPQHYLFDYPNTGVRRFSLVTLMTNCVILLVPVTLMSFYCYRRT